MIRAGELLVFLAPLAGVLLWRLAVRRGMEAPPARQLYLVLAGLVALGGVLFVFAEEERLGPGRYVPAHVEDGQVVRGHSE